MIPHKGPVESCFDEILSIKGHFLENYLIITYEIKQNPMFYILCFGDDTQELLGP